MRVFSLLITVTALLLLIQSVELEVAYADGIPSERVISHDGVTFTIPRNSLVSSPVPNGARIGRGFIFSGRFQLSGTLHYGRYDTYSDKAPEEVYFIPDKAVAERLPYWTLTSYADVITFSNEAEFIKRHIPSDIRKAVKERRPRHYSQRATLLADGLDVWVLCNASYHRTRVLKILYIQPLKVNSGQFETAQC